MSNPPDYLAMLLVEPDDAVQHGIKGMKWGVRRARSDLRAARKDAQKSEAPTGKVEGKDGHTVKVSGPKAGVDHVNRLIDANNKAVDAKKTGNIQDNVESSSDRYARLAAEASEGRASKMTEQDLKFFNARSDALAKINKMNQADPNWLKETTKKVLLSAAEKQMQAVADGVANKYISGPLIDAVGATKKKV